MGKFEFIFSMCDLDLRAHDLEHVFSNAHSHLCQVRPIIEIHSVQTYRFTQNKHYRTDNGRPDGWTVALLE